MNAHDAYLVQASGAYAHAVLPPNLPVCTLCDGREERLVEIDGVPRIAVPLSESSGSADVVQQGSHSSATRPGKL